MIKKTHKIKHDWVSKFCKKTNKQLWNSRGVSAQGFGLQRSHQPKETEPTDLGLF